MKKIAIIADLRGWIFERHAKEIQKRLSHKFDISIGYIRGTNLPKLYQDKDLVYMMSPMIKQYPDRHKTIIGLRSEWPYKNHTRGARGLYEEGLKRSFVSIKDKCDLFHVVNENQYKEFMGVATDKLVMIVQHGVNTSCFSRDKYTRSNKTNHLVVGVSGRDGSPNKKGFEIVKRVCVDHNVEFVSSHYGHGRLSMEEMPQFYNKIDVYVCMSETEGLCNPIMEAGAMGIPVISTRSGAAEEMIQDNENGLLINRDRISLGEALEKMKDVKLRKLFGDAFYDEIVSNWSWDVKIKEYEDMFDLFLNIKESGCESKRY